MHGWVFDLNDGLLKDLKVDFEAMLKSIKKLYNLSAGPSEPTAGGENGPEVVKVAAKVEVDSDVKRQRTD